MKYIITESQVNSLIKVYSNFINSETYEGVCDVVIDYDDEMNKFVLNIFFDKEFVISLNDFSKQTKFTKNMVITIAQKFYDFVGKAPLLYKHYKDC